MKKIFTILLIGLGSMQAMPQAKIPVTDSFEIKGDIKNPQSFSIGRINGLTVHELNDVTTINHLGKTMSVIHQAKGVLLRDVLQGIELNMGSPRESYGFYIECIASDGYKTVFTWNEIFYTSRGENIFLITGKDGQSLSSLDDRIAILDLIETGKGHVNIKGLRQIQIQAVK